MKFKLKVETKEQKHDLAFIEATAAIVAQWPDWMKGFTPHVSSQLKHGTKPKRSIEHFTVKSSNKTTHSLAGTTIIVGNEKYKLVPIE